MLKLIYMVPKFKKGDFITAGRPDLYVYRIYEFHPDSARYVMTHCRKDNGKPTSPHFTPVPALWTEQNYRKLTKAEMILYIGDFDATEEL